MLNDRMLFLNLHADPGATSKHRSFANENLRNDFTPGVSARGGSANTHKYFKLYEEQSLMKATLGASAKPKQIGTSQRDVQKRRGSGKQHHPLLHQQRGKNPSP
jgi:hypothetical protein